jgi:chromosomal replication initiator protein
MTPFWDSVVRDLKGRVSRQSYEAWFSPLRFLSLEGGTCRLEVPNRYFKELFEERHLRTLQESCRTASGLDEVTVELIFADHGRKKPGPLAGEDRQLSLGDAQREGTRRAFLNPRYTFDTFVVGTSNQFAHAACKAVASSTSPVYNPLFIYGGVGLGKTHLLHAIGHRYLETSAQARVCYIQTETFLNEMVYSIHYKRMEQFRSKYRHMDILLMDDIEFIAGKEGTQEEFFHTFNALYEGGKQIVLTSDKTPKEIPELEERLRSRFECGLVADIGLPDLETKVAILRKKSLLNGIALPDDVALYVASIVKSNIRELEGCLTRLGAYSSLQGRLIDLDLAREALGSTASERTRIVGIDVIKRQVATEFGVKLSDLKSQRRVQSIVLPRQVCMYIARKITDLSLPAIGKEFGGKDHTTVLHAERKVSRLLDTDPALKATVQAIIDRIR